MRIIVFIWGIIVSSCFAPLAANAGDTIIRAVYSNSVYYNFIQDSEGRVYVGASDGLYKLEDKLLERINHNPGYVSIKNEEFTRSTYLGIQSNHKYKQILPAHYGEFSHQSLVVNNYIYLICRGSLFIYETRPYDIKMRGTSVRCFSANAIGTYEGIYIYGNRIEIPTYTSGEILEIDSTFYICYDGFAIYSTNRETQLYNRANTGETRIAQKNLGYSRKLMQLKDGDFLLVSTTGIHLVDSSFDKINTFFQSTDNEVPIILDIENSEYQKVISFAATNKLYRYSLDQGEVYSMASFSSSIVDGFKTSNEIESVYVLLLKDEIIIYNYGLDYQENVGGMINAHSIIPIGKDISLISTQNGAHLLFLEANEISPLLFEGIEFNRSALWYSEDTLKLGSTDGYIEIRERELLQMHNELKKNFDNSTQISYSKWYYALLGLILVLLFVVIVYFLKRNKLIEHDNKEQITRLDIEEYIKSDLRQASIEGVKNYFRINNKRLYEITAPEKPGSLISNYRKDKAKELMSKGESPRIVSEVTGFSISYLRKIK